jgi:hypothetical protein
MCIIVENENILIHEPHSRGGNAARTCSTIFKAGSVAFPTFRRNRPVELNSVDGRTPAAVAKLAILVAGSCHATSMKASTAAVMAGVKPMSLQRVTWDWVHQLARSDRNGCTYHGDDLNFERGKGYENNKGDPGSPWENF